MKRCREFQAGKVHQPNGGDATLYLMRAGRPTDASIRGASIEAQFVVHPGFLLLTTDDCPYEESLHITLLDPALRRLDEIELSAAYNTGRLEILETASTEDTMEFRFFDDDRWRLQVLPRPRYLWSFKPFSPATRRSAFVRRRHLRLDRT